MSTLTDATLIQYPSHPRLDQPALVLLPGGPGLSAHSLRALDLLHSAMDLVYVNPPGIECPMRRPANAARFFEEVVANIEAQLLRLNRPVFLCGHSYGGLFAAELAIRGCLAAKALICMATPLSPETLATAAAQYKKAGTPEGRAKEREFYANPSYERFREWTRAYGTLYFPESSRERGFAALSGGDLSLPVFFGLSGRPHPHASFREELRALSIPKFLIAGERDALFAKESLCRDAENLGMGFHVIREAGHFPHIDQPEETAQVLLDICENRAMI